MGSTRLPGKVLKPIAGKPLLWHIVHRLKASQLIEDIAIATTTNPLRRGDCGIRRGERRRRGARARKTMCWPVLPAPPKLLDADIIVRVSSDAPFMDAGFIDHLVASLIEQDGDYVLMEEGAALRP